MKIIITGDVHAKFGKLNSLISRKNPDVVIVCGDFGYWPEWIENKSYCDPSKYTRLSDFKVSDIKNNKTRVYWVPGNHEHWGDIEKNFYRNSVAPMEMEAGSNVFYCPIGSVIHEDGKNFLCVGGAASIDKDWRIHGETWFPQENLRLEDYTFIKNNIKDIKIDCVISHTCPRDFKLKTDYPEKFTDPNRHVLNEVLNLFHPEKWFFGHWHDFETGYHYHYPKDGLFKSFRTRWCMLDHNEGDKKWWIDYNKFE